MNITTGAPYLILWMIGLCMAVMLVMLFSRPLRTALKAVARGLAGMGAVLVLNIVAAPLGAAVGLNVLTGLVAVLLGIPGVVMLYAMQIFL